MIEIPEVGDRIAIYQYTHPEPTQQQIWEFINNPWQPPFPGAKELSIFSSDWVIICQSRFKRKVGREDHIFILINSPKFDDVIRYTGLEIPLSSCKIMQKQYVEPGHLLSFLSLYSKPKTIITPTRNKAPKKTGKKAEVIDISTATDQQMLFGA